MSPVLSQFVLRVFLASICLVICTQCLYTTHSQKEEGIYTKFIIFQDNWLLIPERPVTTKQLMAKYPVSKKQHSYRDTVNSADKIRKITYFINKYHDDSTLFVNDLRVVGLFIAANRVDTLLIDVRGHAYFMGKIFKIDSKLGSLLEIRDSDFNPKYRLQYEKSKRH